MRILLICDDFWHPCQVPIDGVAPLAEHGFAFDIISNAKEFNPEILQNYPAVILCKADHTSQQDQTSWKTAAVQRAFTNYVENGGGLVAIHNGLVPGEHTEELDRLLGSRFTFHPNNCPVTVQPVKPHPVTEGVGMFCEVDEHYRIEIIADDADVLIASYSPPQGDANKYEEEPYNNTQAWICPAGYVRKQGNGRVCVLTPGHLLAIWLNPEFQRILRNAIVWCAP